MTRVSFIGKDMMVHSDAIVIGSRPTGGTVRAADAPDTPPAYQPMWSLERYRRSRPPFSNHVWCATTSNHIIGQNAVSASQQFVESLWHRNGQRSIPSPSRGIRVDVTPHTPHRQDDDIAPQHVGMVRHRQ